MIVGSELPDGLPEPRIPGGVGEGWWPLVERVHQRLLEIDPDYVLDQVKEKFGTLSYYATPSDGVAYAELAQVIRAAQGLSAMICEWCGNVGELRRGSSWLLTLCDECQGKRELGGV